MSYRVVPTYITHPTRSEYSYTTYAVHSRGNVKPFVYSDKCVQLYSKDGHMWCLDSIETAPEYYIHATNHTLIDPEDIEFADDGKATLKRIVFQDPMTPVRNDRISCDREHYKDPHRTKGTCDCSGYMRYDFQDGSYKNTMKDVDMKDVMNDWLTCLNMRWLMDKYCDNCYRMAVFHAVNGYKQKKEIEKAKALMEAETAKAEAKAKKEAEQKAEAERKAKAKIDRQADKARKEANKAALLAFKAQQAQQALTAVGGAGTGSVSNTESDDSE